MRPALLIALLLASLPAAHHLHAREGNPDRPLIAGRNAISFDDEHPSAEFVGMGFVLKHGGRHYGVTAKHVLLVVNHPQLRQVDPETVVANWQMTTPGTPKSGIDFGRLLNADPGEALDMQVLQRDALVFELADPGPFSPLRLATLDPRPGERLYALGCTFATAGHCRQDAYAGTLLGATEHNWLIDLGDTDPATLRGLSGGPVVNADGELVGIVSNVLPDSAGVPRFAPARLDYLRSVLGKVD